MTPTHALRVILLAVLMGFGPTGCQSLRPWLEPEPLPTDRAPEPKVEETAETAAEDAGAEWSEGEAGAAEDEGEAPLEELRIDVSVRDAPARDFFLNIVEQTPYDVVLHPDVSGTISLVMKGASIPEVLGTVREVYGYEFQRTETGFAVLPARLRSRIFDVDYLHVERSGVSEMRVSSGQLSEQSGGAILASPLGPATSGIETSSTVLESSQVQTGSNSDVWGELRDSLEAIVDSEESSVVVSPQAGVVVVRAMPAELLQVERFLARTRSNLGRQVLLEAKILEVRLSDGYRTGINWAALIESGAKSYLFGQTGGGTLLDDPGLSDIAGNSGILDPRSLDFPSSTDTSAFGGAFTAALDVSRFTAFIELLETQGDVHVLSSPRIAAVNNQKAVIKVGSDEFFVTDVSTTTVTGTVATTTPDVTLTPFFSGVALDVLPQIGSDGVVTLHVHPSISDVVDQTKEITLGDDTLSLPLALSTIRESDSVVRARSGQVVVIGGLMQDVDSRDRAGLPLLGRIPGLGWFFGQRQGDMLKSELVILIRPQVMDETGAPLPPAQVEDWLRSRSMESGALGLGDAWLAVPPAARP